MNSKLEQHDHTVAVIFCGIAVLASILILVQLVPAAFVLALVAWWVALFVGMSEPEAVKASIRRARKALFNIALYCTILGATLAAMLLLGIESLDQAGSGYGRMFKYRFAYLGATTAFFMLNLGAGLLFCLFNIRRFVMLLNANNQLDIDQLPSASKPQNRLP